MASDVILVQGTSIRISTAEMTATTEFDASPTPASELLDCITREMTLQGGSAAEIDVTTICSTAKEFRLGLQDSGSLSISGHWVQSHAAHVVLKAAAADKLTRGFEVTFADGSKFRALGFVQSRSWSISVDGVVTASYTIRLSGDTSEV